jgi:prefoldin subunit 1
MFVLQPLATIEQNLADKVKACEEKVKSIESSKVYLERSIKAGEENLRELILSKKREQTH